MDSNEVDALITEFPKVDSTVILCIVQEYDSIDQCRRILNELASGNQEIYNLEFEILEQLFPSTESTFLHALLEQFSGDLELCVEELLEHWNINDRNQEVDISSKSSSSSQSWWTVHKHDSEALANYFNVPYDTIVTLHHQNQGNLALVIEGILDSLKDPPQEVQANMKMFDDSLAYTQYKELCKLFAKKVQPNKIYKIWYCLYPDYLTTKEMVELLANNADPKTYLRANAGRSWKFQEKKRLTGQELAPYVTVSNTSARVIEADDAQGTNNHREFENVIQTPEKAWEMVEDLKRRRHVFFSKATTYHQKIGNNNYWSGAVTYYSEEGRRLTNQIEKYTDKAIELEVIANMKRKTRSIDLHGYTVSRARATVMKLISRWNDMGVLIRTTSAQYTKKNTYKAFEIVTGKGLHSKNQVSVLYGEVMTLLNVENVKYTPKEASFQVHLLPH